MKAERCSVCLVAYGLKRSTRFLQPWRYLSEVALQLAKQGHFVTILTEQEIGQSSGGAIAGIPVRQLPSVRRFRGKPNPILEQTLSALQPDVLLWSVGLTSFVHQVYPKRFPGVQIGIFSSPIYSLRQLGHIGFLRLLQGISLSGIHVAGALVPSRALRWSAKGAPLPCLVVQTRSTAQALKERFWDREVRVIAPGIDALWFSPPWSRAEVRARLGLTTSTCNLLYFGPPAPLRGVETLIRAIGLACGANPQLRLVILNRRREGEYEQETIRLQRLIARLRLDGMVQVIDGAQPPIKVVEWCLASDGIVLPFELLPSDAPLSVLEARALGKPIITTSLGCLPELVEGHMALLVKPGDVTSLAQAILHLAEEVIDNQAQFLRASFSHRTWEQVGEEWSAFLQSL